MQQMTIQQQQPAVICRPFAKASILVVDDEPAVRKLLKRILERDGYACAIAENAEAALFKTTSQSFDLVISDINMPGRSGIELLKEIKKHFPNMPTLMISGVKDVTTSDSAISLGAYDYILKPFQKDQVLISVKNSLRRRCMELQERFERENMEKVIHTQTTDLSASRVKLKRTLDGVIKAMALAIESRDPYTAGHQQRVARLCDAIGAEMGFSPEKRYWLKMAGMIHDIGKISVPAEILCKPSRLSDAEFSIIKEHPETGYNIVKEIEFPQPIAEIILQHHERLDGSGYPNGLTEDQIYVEAKIIAVADTVEAMASHRPYRASLGIEAALKTISDPRDKLYDPYVAETCCCLFEKKGFEL
jgi:putative nucleotidyltransferase with HDIG domain